MIAYKLVDRKYRTRAAADAAAFQARIDFSALAKLALEMRPC